MRHFAKAKQQVSDQDLKDFASKKFVLENFLFDKQLAFVNDPEPFKVAVCSRRAGKTISCAADLLYTAISNKGVVCLYITLSRNNAKKIIWRDIVKINKDFKLGGVLNEVENSITFPNESIIYLSGAKDATEIEKFRGLALKKVYIDECQSFREYIKDLIDDVIGPALLDYAGTLCLIGTPGPVPTGYFHECAVKLDAWSKHTWTFWDNPHIEEKSGLKHQQLFERELKRRGVTSEDPSVQREFFGRWILDSDSLLLRYTEALNDFDTVPGLTRGLKYHYILGVDVGFKDADALAVLAWHPDDPCTYLVEEVVAEKQGITELVQQIGYLQKKYDIYKIVMDMGGLGKKIGEEMIRRYLIPVEAADKVRKMENVALLNDALRTGRFKAKANSRFAQDSFLIEIDRDKSKPDRIVVSSKFHSDIVDAVLYAFKVSPAYAYEPPKDEKPKWGSKEWADSQTDEMWEKELEGFKAEQSYEKWAKGEEE